MFEYITVDHGRATVMQYSANLPPIDIRVMGVMSIFLNLVFFLIALLFLISALIWSKQFALKSILVKGDVFYNNTFTLRANVMPSLTGNYFTIDLHKIKLAFEATPWVRRAVVQRDFPNQVRVTLEEHKNAAYWGVDSDTKLLNIQGEVFEANVGDLESDDLPRLFGPEKMASQMLRLHQMLNPLFKPHGVGIETIVVSGRESWHIQLENGAGIELGRGEPTELQRRVEVFLSTYPQAGSVLGRPRLESLESADLRHSNAYAMRLRGITTLDIQTIQK